MKPKNRCSKAPRKSIHGPLTSIHVPQPQQSLSRATTHSESSQILVHPAFDSCSEPRFDLMEIQLTIYSISGVVSTRRTRKSSKRPSSRLFSRASNGRDFLAGSLQSSSTAEAKTTSRSLESESLEGYDLPTYDGVPVTAIVSFQRNVRSSGTSVETFLPSFPIVPSAAVEPGSSFRYNASWMKNRSHFMTQNDEEVSKDACTFKFIRTMKRESFRPGLSIDDIQCYANQTIDLKVHLGHRHDMLPLGVASLVVTGDEEGENVIKIPVREASATDVPLSAKTRSTGLRGKNKKANRASFSYDPEYVYSLDANATLRVGVRVVPLSTTSTDENSVDIPCTQTATFIELEDDAMLTAHLRKIADSERKQASSSLGTKTDDAAPDMAVKGGQLIPPIFCVPVGLHLPCTEEQKYVARTPRGKKSRSNQSSKRQTMRPHNMKQGVASARLPGSLLSSLSASSDGTDPASRSSNSCASFADSHLLSVQRMIEANLQAMQLKLGAAATARTVESEAKSVPSNSKDFCKTGHRTLEV